jgi:phosphatidylserine/phosphatidylglycerophosphate/cardiolipin synthase-like enzyme
MHHKLCLIDNKIFITGSANWSKSGFKKNEEVLVIFDKLEESEKASLPKLFLDLESTMEDQTCDAQAA